MAASCARDLAGLRNRALLLLLAEASLNRSTLTGLQAEHVRFTASGVELREDSATLMLGGQRFRQAHRAD